jgi:hypothetical protein
MDNKAIIAVVIIGGAALYIMSTQKKCSCNNKVTFLPETLDKIQEEEDLASTNVKVDSLMPSFGVPRNIMAPSNKPPVFQNYIDVQKNEYFKPKAGVFY